MRQDGYVTILIAFAMSVVIIVLTGLNVYLNKINKEIKDNKAEIQRQLNVCEEPDPPDLRIFWHNPESGAFILKDGKMEKVLNVNSLIRLISQGYVN